MYRIVFLLLSSILFWGCNNKNSLKLPYYNEPTFTPIFIENRTEVDQKINHKIADFSLLNQDSILINQNVFKNKIHIANFIFTSCANICPTMTSHLKIVSDSFKNEDDIIYLSYSVTPWIDQPNILKTYKDNYEITNEKWQFLTGSKSKIYNLARQSYFAEEDIGFSKDSTEFLHTEHFILVDKTKRIRGIYNGTLQLEMQQLIDDINTLKAE